MGSNGQPLVGVLALQGDFQRHALALSRAGAHAVEVRSPDQLDPLHGLIIPGGESTTMLRLLEASGLLTRLAEFAKRHPVYGSCAGAILLAREVRNPAQPSLGLLDIVIERNAYGRQLDSRIVRIQPDDQQRLGCEALEAVFIRAPVIRAISPAVHVLARYQGDPVLVEQGPHLVSTFHPELTEDLRVHKLFLDKIRACSQPNR